QPDHEGCTAAGRAVDADVAAGGAHQVLDHRQAEPGAPGGVLGAEEGFEDLPQHLCVHAVATVGQVDAGHAVVIEDAHLEPAAVGHGVARVGGDVEQHHLQL